MSVDALAWLLEEDTENPGVRYFALRDLEGRGEDDPAVRAARRAIMTSGPVPKILAAQDQQGSWDAGHSGYLKYTGTSWQIVMLAELGADPADDRVQRACEYQVSHYVAPNGGFSMTVRPRDSTVVHCYNGNILWGLFKLGFGRDARVQRALTWQAMAATGEGGIQFLASGTSGPGFACGVNLKQPCGWGAAKAMRAFTAAAEVERTPVLERALTAGAEFLLSRDPAIADYPYTGKVGSAWFKLGFPLSYWSDVLEVVELLGAAGYARDARLANAYRFIESKRGADGRWKLENTLNGKTWADIEQKGKPSKWVTLRALRALARRDA